jgi:glycosyltransferase involved in cell wall biosynthesis
MFDIIVPIFNIPQDFLTRALDSILNQEADIPYSVFVIDGTPPEMAKYDAKALVSSYGFTYFRQSPDHKLVGGARNQGVSAGSNPYLLFLDGDDYWYSNWFSECLTAISTSKKQTAIWSAALDTEYPVISPKTGIHYMKGVYGHYPQFSSVLETHPDYAYFYLLGHPPAPSATMKVPIPQRRHYEFIPAITAYHWIGSENTTNRGSQSGVSVLTEDIDGFFKENSDLFLSLHPNPAPTDLPDDLPKGFYATVKGVMREQTILTNI